MVWLLALLAALTAAGAPLASAQIAYTGAFTPVGGAGSFQSPLGTAIDSHGNIYVADIGAGTVSEIPASCIAGANDASCIVRLGVGGFVQPGGVAVDPNGNVYVADEQSGILEIPASCIAGANNASCVVPLATGEYVKPYGGITVDASGDVFVTLLYLDDPGVYEIAAGCQSWTCVGLLWDNYKVPVAPYNVALNAQGDVYASFFLEGLGGNSRNPGVIEEFFGFGSTPIKEIGSELFFYAYGLAVDKNGDVFVANIAGPTGPGVYEVPASCIAGADNAACTLTLATGFREPLGLTLNAQGGLIVADGETGTVYEQNPQVQSANFGSVNACPAGAASPAPCSQTLTLTYNVAAGTYVGGIVYQTQGGSNLDFKALANDTSATLCHAHNFTKASVCTIDVTFTPQAPGQRNGAIEIYDNHGKVISTTYVTGTGVGPVATFNPAPQTTIGSGFFYPAGVKIDVQKNIYVADTSNHAVKEIDAVTGGNIVTLGGGFTYPYDVALDGAGNVFVPDYGTSTVKEIPASCIAGANNASCVVTLGGGSRLFGDPAGVAVDGSGNLYVSDLGNVAIYELTAASGYTTILTLASGYDLDGGVTVDGQGNVYFIADSNSVYKIAAVGGFIPSTPTITQLSDAFSNVGGIAVDAASNLYVADYGAAKVYELLASDGYSNPIPVGSGFSSPNAVAVDSAGNVYVADYHLASIVKVERSRPVASFNFHNVVLGQTSSSQSLQVQNVGNATLSGSGLTVSPNWIQTASSGTPADCTASFSLNPAAECNISLEFQPVDPGVLSGSLTLTDNSSNAAAATQTLGLSGDGEAAPQTVAFTTVPTQTIGAVATLSATASSGLTAFTYSSLSPTICTVSGNNATMIKAGWCDLKVVQPGNASWLNASATQLVKVNP